MTDIPHYSPSSVNSFLMCPYRYYLSYIEKLRYPPNIAMIAGRGVHSAADINFSQKIDTRIDIGAKDFVDVAVSRYDVEVTEDITIDPDEKKSKDQIVGETRDQVASIADVMITDLCPPIQPSAVEQKLVFAGPEYELWGIIDLVDDKGAILDLKTARKKGGYRQVDTDESKQLTHYALLEYSRTSVIPKVGHRVVRYDKKAPEYQEFDSTRSIEDFQAYLRLVKTIHDSTQAGIFPPTGLGQWVCSDKWCGYHRFGACPYITKK